MKRFMKSQSSFSYPCSLRRFLHKSCVVSCLALFVLFVYACDSGRRPDNDGPTGTASFTSPVGGGGGGGGSFTVPILTSVSHGSAETLCVGSVCTLEGINFSPNLEENVVTFRAGSTSIRGAPLDVTFPPGGGSARASLLRVLVPSGVVNGSIELEVNGIFAGAFGYVACPMVTAFDIGEEGDFEHLEHNVLGFTGVTTVRIHGLNFEEVNQVVIQDSTGAQVTLTTADFRRRNVAPTNGYDTLVFTVEGLRLSIREPRDRLIMNLATSESNSNSVSVPVVFVPGGGGEPLGPVINGVIMPVGVRTGPVRLRYSILDRPIDMAYEMLVQWTVNPRDDEWFNAKLKFDDPEADGADITRPNRILPGSMAHPPISGLIRAPGAIRTYTWDAQNDVNFRALNNAFDPSEGRPSRNWQVSFRIEARMAFESQDRAEAGILFVTPPISYIDLEDRPGEDSIQSVREAEFVEDFRSSARRDDEILEDMGIEDLTAFWGPPDNAGALEGRLGFTPTPKFGVGTVDLTLDPFAPDDFEGETVLNEFYRFDTSNMTLTQVAVVLVEDDENPEVEIEFPIFPTLREPNPGEDAGEFHFRSLNIPGVTDVDTIGRRPLVIRLSSGVVDSTEVSLTMNGVIDGSGESPSDNPNEITMDFDGPCEADVPPPPCPPGDGGRGRLGGGDGGRGGEINTSDWDRIRNRLGFSVVRAGDGGNFGGLGGDTPGALNPDKQAFSRYAGGPGGGGGHRLAGCAGDPPRSSPSTFPLVRGGDGGPNRGSEKLKPLTAGSGGGGGGATVVHASSDTFLGETQPFQGAGGGSGGGAIHIVAAGSIVIGQLGLINVDGGDGGRTDQRSGHGGGGSGGSIYLEAGGAVVTLCNNLRADGGLGGRGGQSNRAKCAGNGGAGWIRVDAGFAGGPACTSLSSRDTNLTDDINTSATLNEVEVSSTAGFPNVGVLRIGGEQIAYDSRDGTAFSVSERGFNGTPVESHDVGAVVELVAPVTPPGSLVGDQIQESSDIFQAGIGPDGFLHCFFQPSLDPNSNDVLRDENGVAQSIWLFNTDRGVVSSPTGFPVLTAISSERGVLQLTRLILDEGVTLRLLGANPARFLITDICDISGTIDASGFDGGLLRFDTALPNVPLLGRGGDSGPGGGRGGDGATIDFLSAAPQPGVPLDKNPSNLDVIPAHAGGFPEAVPPTFDVTSVKVGGSGSHERLTVFEAVRPTGGATLRETACEGDGAAVSLCIKSGGGGGGGGHLVSGENGMAKPSDGEVAGTGGSPLGFDSLRFEGQVFPVGGMGGGGGGASAALSQTALNDNNNSSVFDGRPEIAPGTGGGGGGGFVQFSVRGSFNLRKTGVILSRGGNAYQSYDLGGNGGAGAGGTVLIQAQNSLTLSPGSRIDVRGGRANRRVPVDVNQGLPLYDGNVVGNPDDERSRTTVGGLGGSGADGRVLIEVPQNSNVLGGTAKNVIFSGLTLHNAVESLAFSIPLEFGVGESQAIRSEFIEFGSPSIEFTEFGVPQGTDAIVVWEPGFSSPDHHARVGGFFDGVEFPRDIKSFDFLRFRATLLSDFLTQQAPSIKTIRLRYRLQDATDN